MLRSERYSYCVPFPRLPENIKATYSIGDLALRPFGLFEGDLDVDFTTPRSIQTGIQILQCCTRDKKGQVLDQTFFWALPISKRIECLLTLVRLCDIAQLPVLLTCSNETCRRQMELEISLDELLSVPQQANTTDPLTIKVGGESMHIRKPTGRDQLEWQTRSFPNADFAIRAMIQTLLIEHDSNTSDEECPIPEDWIPILSESMEGYDPLISFHVVAVCPYCDEEGKYELDLEALSLRELHQAQQKLLQSVHRLAGHYHWSEQQILSLPPWRRTRYLALIEEMEN